MDDWESRYNQRKRGDGRLSAGMKIPLQRPESPNIRLREWCGRDARLNADPTVRSAPDLNQFQVGGIGNAVMNPYQQQPVNNTNSGGYQDVSQAVMNRLPTAMASAPVVIPQQIQEPLNNQQQSQIVRLQAGTPIFKALETNGFTEVTLCRSFGNLPQNWITEYKIVGKRSCYVVNPQEKHIDVARIKSNPNSLTTLVELRSPNFMIGTLFVEESYLANNNMQQQQNRYNGRSVMNDSYHRSPYQQQLLLPQNQQHQHGRILLAG